MPSVIIVPCLLSLLCHAYCHYCAMHSVIIVPCLLSLLCHAYCHYCAMPSVIVIRTILCTTLLRYIFRYNNVSFCIIQ